MKKVLLLLLISVSVVHVQANVKADMPHGDKLCLQVVAKIVQLPTKYGKKHPMWPKPRRSRIMPLLHKDPFVSR